MTIPFEVFKARMLANPEVNFSGIDQGAPPRRALPSGVGRTNGHQPVCHRAA
jgi:hypothetical protein